MKQIFADLKKGIVKLKVDNLDDLWYLSQIIDVGDLISGKTERKVKLGGENDRSGKNIRKFVYLEVEAEKIVLEDNVLRVNGKVKEGTDEVSAGSYHTFSISQEDHTFTLKKNQWMEYHKSKLHDALSYEHSKIIFLVIDRETAIFAISRTNGYDILATLNGEVNRKDQDSQAKGSFYSDVEKVLIDYVKNHTPKHVVLASPAFFKEDFMKNLKDLSLKKIITLATVGSATQNAISELLKRSEVAHILKQDVIANESKIIDKLMQEISKDGLSVYGFKETKKAADSGAVASLLVTDALIKRAREEKKYKILDDMMKIVSQTKGKVHIVSVSHEAGKQLDGLGGVGGILRYKL